MDYYFHDHFTSALQIVEKIEMLKYFLTFNLILTISFALRISESDYVAYTKEMPVILPGGLRNYTSLYVLDSEITILQPPHLSNMENIEELVIGNARYLREIRDGVLNNSTLKKLKVSVSRLRRIGYNALDDMPNLKEVSFIYGRIVKLSSKWFKNSHNVEELILSHNWIRTLPRMIFKNIFNVKFLSLDSNVIEFICPYAFRGLRKVETIVLTNNRIHAINRITFSDHPRLTTLDFAQNNITCFANDVLGELAKVKEVWISRERLDRYCALKINRYYKNFRIVS